MAKSRITIVGLGLIGASMGLALKKAKIDAEIVGHDKNMEVAGKAQKMGAVDKTDWNLIGACEGAGFIILSLPLNAVKDTLHALQAYLPRGVIVTDTAATKAPVMEWARLLPEGVEFVGGDPILNPRRGSPRGQEAASADLFQDATFALTASTTASPTAIETVSNFASLIGAKPYFIEAAEHDGLTAGVQHLPALLGVVFGNAIMRSPGWKELRRLAGSDFRAATDLVPPDAGAAREQFLAHRADLLRWVSEIRQQLAQFQATLERGDARELESMIGSLNGERAKWLSGSLDEKDTLDVSSAQPSLSRLFLGGLADRGKKK